MLSNENSRLLAKIRLSTILAGATIHDARGAIATQRRKRAEKEKGEAHTRALETTMAPVNAQLQLSTQQLAQSGQQFNATMQRTMAQDAKNYQLQLMNMAENRDARAAELEYQKLRDRKADMQYNERMEQLDQRSPCCYAKPRCRTCCARSCVLLSDYFF